MCCFFFDYCSFPTNNSTFRSNGGFRKRKADATDLDEKYIKRKYFLNSVPFFYY